MEVATARRLPSGKYFIRCILPFPRRALVPTGTPKRVWFCERAVEVKKVKRNNVEISGKVVSKRLSIFMQYELLCGCILVETCC